ncbi:MAG: hypothetical protein H6747_03170 [Deltaproteobacteria bacterium]|nr:hypothetical protein [Deltaproteobacteria bacterium]
MSRARPEPSSADLHPTCNRTQFACLFTTLALLAGGCSSTTEQPHDAASGHGDVGPDGSLDAGSDGIVAGDVSDTSDSIGADTAQPCTLPPVQDRGVDAGRKRFAMSLFHFNVEYVIGGLDYTDKSGKNHIFVGVEAAAGWDDQKVEDWIVRETFVPILQMYEAHPSWGVDIELQGRFVDVLRQRFPDALTLLRTLVARGQVELISFHQNAQLFLAFPRTDLDRSVAATKLAFDQACLPLSKVVFNQEGQAGEGRQKALVDHGYEVGVFPKNLWRYVRGEGAWWPWYASEGGTLIVGPGGVDPASGVEVAWDIFDDGELFAVPAKLNPYFAPITQHDDGVVATLAAKLSAKEASGFYMATIGEYVRHLQAIGVEKKPAPPLLDGTWQAPSTDSIHRWLGGRSDVFSDGESDNLVRAGNFRAREELLAAEVLVHVAQAAGKDVGPAEAQLDQLWRALFRAEVSDGSGVNPWIGERLFCHEHNEAVILGSTALQQAMLGKLGWKHASIDTGKQTAVALDDLPLGEPPEEVDPPLAVTITAPGRKVKSVWHGYGPKRRQLELSFAAAGSGAPCKDCDQRHVEVAFARADHVLRYSPGLLDQEVRTYAETAFTFLEGQAFLPLANGLIGLGNDRWLIKLNRAVHIAARIAPDDDSIRFIDRSLQPEDVGAWSFIVFDGTEAEALALALLTNVWPHLLR